MGNFLEGKQCYLVVLGSFLITLSLGEFYAFGTIESSLISFMNNSSMSRGNVNVRNVTWVFGLMAFSIGAAVSAGGILGEKIGSSWTILIGGWLMSLNVALTYYTINTYLSVVAISYGLFSGIGTGLSYGVALGASCKWFPNNRGLIIGIVLSGFAISSAVFTQIQFSIIHMRSNLDRLPFSFLVLGLTYAILQFLGSLLIKDKSENDEEITTGNSFPDELNQLRGIFDDRKCLLSEQKEFKTHQLFLEFDFWILWWTMFINTSSLLIFQSLYVSVASIIVCPILSSFPQLESKTVHFSAFIIAGAILLISAGLTFLFRGKSLVLNRL